MTKQDIEETERTTIEEARRKSGASGVQLAAPSPVSETGVTYLGVEEPIVLDDAESSTGDRSTNDTSA